MNESPAQVNALASKGKTPIDSGSYKGVSWAVYRSPLFGENGYVLIPKGGRFKKLRSAIINRTIPGWVISGQVSGVKASGEGDGWPVEITYVDDDGWIGFDTSHENDAWKTKDGFESFETAMINAGLEIAGWSESDVHDMLDLPTTITRVWTHDDVIKSCELLINAIYDLTAEDQWR